MSVSAFFEPWSLDHSVSEKLDFLLIELLFNCVFVFFFNIINDLQDKWGVNVNEESVSFFWVFFLRDSS